MTVFIPTYNRAKYLRQCLEALEQQYLTPSELDVVVSDNASDDETPEVVKEFPSLKLRYSGNEENLGLCANFNRVLDLCQTEFVVLLPDDVLLTPGFLQRALDALSRNEGATMYATAALVTNPSIHAPLAKVLTPHLLAPSKLWSLRLQTWGYETWAAACAFRPPIYTGAAAFRFSFLSEAMPWREDQVANADRLTYFEAGRRGEVLFDPWVGVHAIYDGHNFGDTISVETSRAEYRTVTQHIIDRASEDGIDVLGYWRNNIENYSRQDQKEILASARFALTKENYTRTFGDFNGFTVERLGGRLDRWSVPPRVARLLRALNS
jgi:glycosyltransferase involved in cell wall biosynthesis